MLRFGQEQESTLLIHGAELARFPVMFDCKHNRDKIRTRAIPRVLGAGYRRTLSFSVFDLFAERSEKLERWSFVLTGAAFVRESSESAYYVPLLPSPTRTSDKPEDNTHTDYCQNFETFVTTSQQKHHFVYGDLIATRTVLVKAFLIASVTFKSPLID